MRYRIILLLFFLFTSCLNKHTSLKQDCINNSGMKNDLYNAVKTYQVNNPIPVLTEEDRRNPSSPLTAFKYIYQVYFEKRVDTIVIITLRPDGINFITGGKENRIFGIYEDSCLKPTYCVDNNNYSKEFLKYKHSNNLDSFRYNNSSIIDIMYVSYVYRIKKNKLVFEKKIIGNIGR